MAEKPASSPAEIDLKAYDAPLPKPSASFLRTQTRKGTKGSYITDSTVVPADLSNKWVLISGSNNGVGRSAAIQMARMGANLILACRESPPRETSAEVVVEECFAEAKKAGHEKSQVEWWKVDMASVASVEALAKRWLDTGRALDYLCNNAGMGSSPGGSEVFRTDDGFEIIHQVNFLSHVLLTLYLLPSIAKAPEPRIVCTTSCYHYPGVFDLSNFNAEKGLGGLSGVQYYKNNKLWFQIWLTELQSRLLRHNQYKHITVNGIHPGYVNSGVWNLNSVADQGIKEKIVKLLAWFFAITPDQGGLAITYNVTAVECGPNPKMQGIGVEGGKGGGRYFNRVWEEEPHPYTKNEDARLRVWRKVNDELGLKDKGLLDVLGLYSTD